MNILTVAQSNFKKPGVCWSAVGEYLAYKNCIFLKFQASFEFQLPLSQPAIKPGYTKHRTPHCSHNTNNCVRLTNLLLG